MATAVRSPDAELLRRLRERERGAWEELYAEYQPRLRAFGYRLAGNVHDADDLVQETFVRAVPRLDQLDPDTADIGAYLFTTLRNLFLKQVERTKRQEPVAEVPEPVLPTPIEDDPERGTMLRRQQDEVRLANARLQPRQRLVLALRELEDRSYAEIGEIVGMKENAVAQLIFRARESLRTELRLVQVDPERLPEECRRYLPLLAAHLDGQLKGPRLEETLGHLDACERCQAALADMREASRRYRTVLLPLGLEADEARAAVEQRLDAAGYWAAGRRGGATARRSKRIGVALAVAVVLGGGGAALGVAVSREPARADAQATSDSIPSATTTSRATTNGPPPQTAPETSPPAPKPKTQATTGVQPTVPPTSPAQKPATEPAVTAPKPAPKPEAKPTPTPEPKQTTPKKPPPDTTAPIVTITGAPGQSTSTDAAEIRFRASEDGVAFTCTLDGAVFEPCASPIALAGLAAGQHTFSVLATDEAGNVGKPASATWTYTPPDTTPPTVTIGAGPAPSTIETDATFTFSAGEDGVAFECSLDGGAWSSCSSPASYSPLGLGGHTFAVRGTDHAGNTGQPASYTWTVVQPLPDLVVSALAQLSATVTNRGTAAAGRSVLTITLVGTFNVPSLAPGASVTFSWSVCRVGTYTAIVDRTQAVAESDETNNTTSRRNTCS
ncbi:MAG TPA: sigma-70 family RNA polymerase sigma factor [Gaiella sp.]|jgi:RNA polymerase sigma factor (sigma-70 family)